MDHMLGSKWQFIELIRLGFSVSSDEVTRYKQSTVVNENTNDITKRVMQGYFSQWSGINVDHNVSSLNEKEVLHVMGVVVLSTALSDNEARKLPSLPTIPGQKLKKASDVVQWKGIPILKYKIPEESGLSMLMFKKMSETFPSFRLKDLHLETLWHALRFNPKLEPESCSGWSGYISVVSSRSYPEKSMVHMLHIIDLNPKNISCIATLSFIIQQSQESAFMV